MGPTTDAPQLPAPRPVVTVDEAWQIARSLNDDLVRRCIRASRNIVLPAGLPTGHQVRLYLMSQVALAKRQAVDPEERASADRWGLRVAIASDEALMDEYRQATAARGLPARAPLTQTPADLEVGGRPRQHDCAPRLTARAADRPSSCRPLSMSRWSGH